MDISFTCTDCNTALEIDASMAGSQIACPTCGTVLTVPAPPPAATAPAEPPHSAPETAVGRGVGFGRKLSVGEVQAPPTASIAKGRSALEVQAKAGVRLHVKTFRRSDCLAGGKDTFDDTVSKFIHSLADNHLVSVQPLQYSIVDKGMAMMDYGVIIVYRQ